MLSFSLKLGFRNEFEVKFDSGVTVHVRDHACLAKREPDPPPVDEVKLAEAAAVKAEALETVTKVFKGNTTCLPTAFTEAEGFKPGMEATFKAIEEELARAGEKISKDAVMSIIETMEEETRWWEPGGTSTLPSFLPVLLNLV